MPEFIIAVLAVFLAVGGGYAYVAASARQKKDRALATSHPDSGALPGDSLAMIQAKNAAYGQASDLAHLLEKVAMHDDIVSSLPVKLRADIDAALRDFYPTHK